jgi:hyperosmotically inducible periplasmic protein
MARMISLFLMPVILAISMACRTNESPEGQVKDARIAAAIKAKLASDLNPTTLTNVSVNVTNSVVTLSGQVNSGESKRRAEEIARSVEGVVSVNDNLQVQPPT